MCFSRGVCGEKKMEKQGKWGGGNNNQETKFGRRNIRTRFTAHGHVPGSTVKYLGI